MGADGNAGVARKYYLLVDYDNFALNIFGGWKRYQIRPQPLYDLVRRLAQHSDFFDDAGPKSRVFLRLYGGWYFYNTLSYVAQDIQAAQLIGPLGLYHHANVDLSVYCYFAHNLQELENSLGPLFGTFRHQRLPSCPKCGKAVYVNDDRQKLVDTMLCCDLTSLSQQPGTAVAVVTSDDDLFPPLLQQACSGKKVYHMLTTPELSQSFSSYYQPLIPTTYHCIPY